MVVRPGCLVVLALAGCQKVVVDETGEPRPTVTFETHLPTEDTETDPPDPPDTSETGHSETSHSETEDTGPLWSEVTLRPDGLVVGVGAHLPLRLRATDRAGVRTTPASVGWVSSDLAVVSIVDGVAVANGPGTATLSARFDGFEANATLEVVDGGRLTVRVVDGITGAPVPDAMVVLGVDELPTRTDAKGTLVVEGVAAEPVTVSVVLEGYVTATVAEVVGREVVVPVRPASVASALVPSAIGVVDMSALSAGISEIAVGVVGGTLPGSPYWFSWTDLVAEAREVTILGVTVLLPGNVVIQDNNESWSLSRPAGTHAFWGLATVMPLADALSAGNGDIDAFSLVAEYLDDAWWGVVGPVDVGKGAFAETLPLVTQPSLSMTVSTPARPDFATGAENVLVLALGRRDEGLLTVGMGAGYGTVDVRHVSTPTPEQVLAIYQQDYVGSGLGTSLAIAPVVDGAATIPAFVDLPQAPSVYLVSEEVRFNADPDAQLVLVEVVDRVGFRRDIYAPCGVDVVDLPTLLAPIDWYTATWSVRVVALDVGTYEHYVARGPLDEGTLATDTVGAGLWSGEVAPSES